MKWDCKDTTYFLTTQILRCFFEKKSEMVQKGLIILRYCSGCSFCIYTSSCGSKCRLLRLLGCSKNPPFIIITTDWDVLSLFECFVFFICICLTFTQSQCSHCSFVQANHLLNKIPQITSKAIFRTSLLKYAMIYVGLSSAYPRDILGTSSGDSVGMGMLMG